MKPAETAPPALPKIGPSDRLGAIVPAPAATALDGADLTNVIVLAHRRSGAEIEAPAVTVDDKDRPAPAGSWRDATPWTALIAAALLLHLGLVVFFMRDPTPMPSLALDSISVEIVLGGQTEAGTAQTPSSAQSAPSSPAESPSKPAEQPAEPIEQPKPDLRPRLDAEVSELASKANTPEEQTPQEQMLQEQPPQEQAPQEQASQEQAPQEQARDEPEPEQPQAAAVEPDPSEAVAEPEPTPAPSEPKPVSATAAAEAEIAPKQAETETEKAKPVEQPVATQPPPKDAAPATPRERSKPAPARVAAAQSGVGVGSSRAIRDWASQVSAHLARNKRYPADALARGIGGTASVAFTLDGNGHVTSVRLVRSSGSASLDRESRDLVRRASPFPPPPQGKASITVPVNFNVRTGR